MKGGERRLAFVEEDGGVVRVWGWARRFAGIWESGVTDWVSWRNIVANLVLQWLLISLLLFCDARSSLSTALRWRGCYTVSATCDRTQ